MNHENAQTLLSEYLEGSLAPEVRTAIQEHLQGCPECTRDQSLLKRTLDLAQKLHPVKAPSQFAQRVHAKARKAGLVSRRWRRTGLMWWIPLEAILAVLLAAMGAIVVLHLLARTPLEPIPEEGAPLPVVQMENPMQLSRLLTVLATFQGGGFLAGRRLEPRTDLSQLTAIELRVPRSRQEELNTALTEAGLPLPPPDAVLGSDDRLRWKVLLPLAKDNPGH